MSKPFVPPPYLPMSLWEDPSVKAMLEWVRRDPPTKEDYKRFRAIKRGDKIRGYYDEFPK